VAVINGHLAKVSEGLTVLEAHAQETQSLESRKLLDASTFLQGLASAALALALVPVIAIVLLLRQRLQPMISGETVIYAAAPPGEPGPAPVLDAPDPVITLDANGCITAWNARAAKVLGRVAEEVQGGRFADIVVAPRHREAFERDLREAFANDDAATLDRRFEILALDSSGAEIPVELAIVPVRGGDTPLWSVFLHDITEHRRAQDQLQRLSLIASRTASGVVITDAQGQTDWVNDAFVRLTGRSIEECRGWTLDALLGGSQTEPAALETLNAAIRARTEFRVELARDSGDGRLSWVEVEATPAFDDQGALTQFIAIVTDITERKRVETALRESEARARAVVDHAVDAVLQVDHFGVITTVNPAAERVFGYKPGELSGKPVRALMPGFETANGEGPALDTGAEIIAASRELEGRRRNGTAFPIELSLNDTEIDGRHVWTGVVRDITPRKRAEALQAGQNRVLELLAREVPLEESLDELIRVIEGQQQDAVCMVLILRPGHTRLAVGASPTLPDDLARAVEAVEIGPAGCTWGAAAYLGQRVIAEDTATHPAWTDYRTLALEFGLRSSWAEPIVSGSGSPLGVFVTFRRRVHMPDAPELELISFAAHLASIAIERTLAAETLRTYALELDDPQSRAA
jgi:PAS domain S-box-containing protein